MWQRAVRVSLKEGGIVVDGSGVGITTSSFNNEHSRVQMGVKLI